MLHGGPGDTHHYLRDVAKILKEQFTCVLFDQRGSGRSFLTERNESTVSLPKFINDIDSILDFYRIKKTHLFGHSWGAMLGLFYNLERPERVAKSALVSMGPLTDKYGEQNHQRTLQVLDPSERLKWEELKAVRDQAAISGDRSKTLMADNAMMYLRVKSWIVNSALHKDFLEQYFSDPPCDRQVNKWVWKSLYGYFQWENAGKISNPVWLCTGSADATPIEQQAELSTWLKKHKTTVLDHCGHIPWLERPYLFYEALTEFLNDETRT